MSILLAYIISFFKGNKKENYTLTDEDKIQENKALKELLNKNELNLFQNFDTLLWKYNVYQNSISFKFLKNLLLDGSILYNKPYRFFYRNNKKTTNNKIYGKGIYIIYFDISNLNNKEKISTVPCYIGQSKNITNRWIRHINNLQKCINGERTEVKYNKIIQFARKYNLRLEYLRFSILERSALDNLNLLEQKYIKEFSADLYGWNWLFNK